ncbi:MFS transporter [Actinoallomurus sp. NPDC052308]|uniref:MFS transporter n=1 Tax=Actinoallomurus sp. NPDC052308 TaxID=3155530 RepID=UPI003449E76A
MRRLIFGRINAALATALIPTTLTLAVVRATGSSGALGVVLACELIPMLVLLPVAGVVADRFPAQRVVLTADLLRGAAQAAIGVELLRGPARIPELAALSAVTGAGVAFGTPAVRRLVAGIVDGADRLRANARLGVAEGLAQMAAPAAAGGLVLAAGPGWSSLLTAGLFAVSATTLGGLVPRRAAPVVERERFTAELREGWRETRRHPWFLASVTGHGVWHLAAGFLLTLAPVIAVRHMGGDAAWVVIAQAGTAGMLIGVFGAGRLRIRRPLVAVAFGGAAYGLPLAALGVAALAPSTALLAVVVLAYFTAMLGLGVLSPLWETTLQRRIPQDVLGRVGSFDALISFASRPFGMAVAAPIAAVTGTAAPLLGLALLVAGANLAVLLLADVRGYRGDPLGEPHPRELETVTAQHLVRDAD